jgi:hypothetical protein
MRFPEARPADEATGGRMLSGIDPGRQPLKETP